MRIYSSTTLAALFLVATLVMATSARDEHEDLDDDFEGDEAHGEKYDGHNRHHEEAKPHHIGGEHHHEKPHHENKGPLGGMLDILGGKKVEQHHHSEGSALAKAVEAATHLGKGPEGPKPDQGGPFKAFTDLSKLILNPLELTKQISQWFFIPLPKLIEAIGAPLVFGVEAILSPWMACLKIVEKVFKPDACRLKFICKLGSQLHFVQNFVLKLTPGFVDGSSQLKAFTEGFSGKECEVAYSECGGGIKLKKPFEELKEIKETKIIVEKDKIIGGRGLSGTPALQNGGDSSSSLLTGEGVAAAASQTNSAQVAEISKATIGQVKA